MTSQKPRGFAQAHRQAESYAKNRDRTRRLVDDVLTKAYRNRGKLQKIWDDLLALCRLVRAWARGEYRLPWKSLVLAIAAIIYFLNPLDMSPDVLPVLGYLDDAAVIGFVFGAIRKDLDHFLAWEAETGTPATSAG